ncbi:MAG: hypothetical protein ACR65T_06200 [Methylocystis sp.]|uniref:hypothetical protein n=1 Tax=Methylocystis sp. TaxID=1911079 RepID=UPI003DA6A6ED
MAAAAHEAERVFVAVRVDADRRDEDHVLVHVNAVDLDRQQIEIIESASQGHRWRARIFDVSADAPHRAHDILDDVHDGKRDDRAGAHRQSIDVESANARALDLDLAAVEADLASRPPPAMRLAPFAPLVTLAADRRRILLHHLVRRLDPGGKAKPLEARRHARQRSAFSACVGIAFDVVCSFMALLSFRGISTPSLTAQGEQRRSSIFNFLRDIPPARPADFWPI